jgi:hypothetical protein
MYGIVDKAKMAPLLNEAPTSTEILNIVIREDNNHVSFSYLCVACEKA